MGGSIISLVEFIYYFTFKLCKNLRSNNDDVEHTKLPTKLIGLKKKQVLINYKNVINIDENRKIVEISMADKNFFNSDNNSRHGGFLN